MSLVARVAYNGRGWRGFQRQPDLPTIQGEIEDVLSRLAGRPCPIIGASRTDAGVHARGQVVAWSRHDWAIPPERVPSALNQHLAPSIRVLDAWVGPPRFDPSRAAVSKTYSYTLDPRGAAQDPWAAGWAWTPGGRLSLTALNEAARLFLGRHDFRAFRGEGSSARTTVRTVLAAHWEAVPPYWRFWVTGDGFLYHMVRFMVGSMIEAIRRDSMAGIEAGLANPEGRKAATPAPPEGLCLEWVEF